MKKLESSFKNMVIVLTAVTVISGVLLGYMNEITRDPIAQANERKKTNAIASIVPGFTPQSTITVDTVEIGGAKYLINKVTNGNDFIGAAVEAAINGFSGEIRIIVGFDAAGRITDYSVLGHSETPGLGSKMDEWFRTDKNRQSIKGLNPGETPLRVTKDGGSIDAITASTITSRAFLSAVNNAYLAYAAGDDSSAADGASGATSSN